MSCETHDIVVLQFSLRRAGSLCILTVLIFILVAVPVPSEAQVSADSFVTTWRTTTPGELITIPTGGATPNVYTIDWGDGTISDSVSGDQAHEYAEPGDYQVSISGDFIRIYLSDMPNAKKTAFHRSMGCDAMEVNERGIYGCIKYGISCNRYTRSLGCAQHKPYVFMEPHRSTAISPTGTPRR